MVDDAANLALAQLCEMRAEMAVMRTEIENRFVELRADLSDVNRKVHGPIVMPAPLAGHVPGFERLDAERRA